MFQFFLNIVQVFFSIFIKRRKDIILTIMLLKKENQILKHHLDLKNKKIYTNSKDRFSISLIGCLSRRAINHLSIVKPKTLLNWQRKSISKRWTHKYKRKGRPQIKKSTKDLILDMMMR